MYLRTCVSLHSRTSAFSYLRKYIRVHLRTCVVAHLRTCALAYLRTRVLEQLLARAFVHLHTIAHLYTCACAHLRKHLQKYLPICVLANLRKYLRLTHLRKNLRTCVLVLPFFVFAQVAYLRICALLVCPVNHRHPLSTTTPPLYTIYQGGEQNESNSRRLTQYYLYLIVVRILTSRYDNLFNFLKKRYSMQPDYQSNILLKLQVNCMKTRRRNSTPIFGHRKQKKREITKQNSICLHSPNIISMCIN